MLQVDKLASSVSFFGHKRWVLTKFRPKYNTNNRIKPETRMKLSVQKAKHCCVSCLTCRESKIV